MKITKDKVFTRLDRLADRAIYFGLGYGLLSTFKAETARSAGLVFVVVGLAVSVALFPWRKERRRRFKLFFKEWQGQPAFVFSLKNGTSRDDLFRKLKEMQATILRDSPELVSAEVRTSPKKPPTRVEITFCDGKLSKFSIQQVRLDESPEPA
jgi:hypothetical protein